ncbi:DUF1674 domain-containing protein [Bartonella ancashensis]|uniref:DUF1674 domain-containing protein n=1 Tax=Bartonella ancashensis TaxID=1318743 RepID=A0A0M4LJ25_9HYPH|nr:DUF1674 domain-containing protein [Bartonella ancashensis]ALE03202.1 hypothetical protein PU02_0388 [Bartonella ancashensis]
MNKQHKEMNNTVDNRFPLAAQRALQEAAERRLREMHEAKPLENGGRGGKDPARYGDWEINGRAIDF